MSRAAKLQNARGAISRFFIGGWPAVHARWHLRSRRRFYIFRPIFIPSLRRSIPGTIRPGHRFPGHQGALARWPIFHQRTGFLHQPVHPGLEDPRFAFYYADARIGRVSRKPVWPGSYKVIRIIDPWNMLEVFLLSICVSMIEMGEVATVHPGRGRFFLCGSRGAGRCWQR